MPGSKTAVAPTSARERIFVEILRDLENRRIVPGQRIAETDLVPRFGVSRNAVREGIQLLAGQGIVDLSPNKSPTIRVLTLDEALGVLDISELLTGLLARAAAENHGSASTTRLAEAMAEIEAIPFHAERDYSRAQRHFTSAMLQLSGNKELQRIYPMVGMAIFTAQFLSPEMVKTQKKSLKELYAAITAHNPEAAERIGRTMIAKQRDAVRKFFA